MISHKPLCVDLDGTLLRTDALYEAILKLVKKSPFFLFYLGIWCLKGRAYLKFKIFQQVHLDPSLLPVNQAVLDWLRIKKQQGRKLILISASEDNLVKTIGQHLGLFDEMIGSGKFNNLKAQKKADYLVHRYGKKEFDYVGDSKIDLPVWKAADQSIIVSHRARLLKLAENDPEISIEKIFFQKSSFLKNIRKSCRVHQYIKNILIFLPLVLGYHKVTTLILLQAFLGFAAFCTLASSLYILNDLLDLEADRLHPTKKYRPFASGEFALSSGIQWMLILWLISIIFIWFLPWSFQCAILCYAILTTAYSFWLKQMLLVDVFVLAGLYTLRILAGTTLIQQELAHWLLLFSTFFFLSLAFVKRYTELHHKNKEVKKNNEQSDYHQVAGRGYLLSHLEILGIFGILSGYLSALVMALYVSSDQAIQQYHHPNFLYFICPLIMYWFSRLWLITYEGRVHQDPVLFALKDKVSYIALGIVALFFLLTIF